MFFGELDTVDAAGTRLAHSLRTTRRRLRKGELLTDELIEELLASGVDALSVYRLDADDVDEDRAAATLGQSLHGSGITISTANTGRVNLHAEDDGLCVIDRSVIDRVNSVHESLSIATVAPDSPVRQGRLVATVKIIPYALPADILEQALAVAGTGAIEVHAQQAHRAVLVQTRLPGTRESVLDKSSRTTRDRLALRGVALYEEFRCQHAQASLIRELRKAMATFPDWLLIIGASAISDRRDVIPRAVEALGGQVTRLGLPMDPGNLLMMAEIGGTCVIGLPGCARSPAYNGIDRVLDRLASRVPVTDAWLASLGTGGLVGEIVERPRPRVPNTGSHRVAGLLLAAGRSSRMPGRNKLLERWHGKPLIVHARDLLHRAGIERVVVVTGHEQTQIREALAAEANHESDFVHNAAHHTGMASSLVAGVSRLHDVDAIVVALGDMPLVEPDVIGRLVEVFAARESGALFVPVLEGERGNPVLIARPLFDSVLRLTGDVGARVLMQRYPESVVEVPVNCVGITQDVDTADALDALREGDVTVSK